jgi:cyclopropane fatty-acyl-phospholipid synthase-like methyltransferase
MKCFCPMSKSSRQAQHFERLYRENPDPWSFTTSRYEQQKYEATLSALGTRRFQLALEVGCSIGVLTSRLAARCDELVGVDFAASAVAAARVRCARLPGVRIEHMQVPRQWPKGLFDLILFSEVLYFLDESDLRETCAQALHSLLPDGLVLLVNYTGETDDPLDGDTAASSFIKAAAPTLQPILERREPHYRLDLLAVSHLSRRLP